MHTTTTGDGGTTTTTTPLDIPPPPPPPPTVTPVAEVGVEGAPVMGGEGSPIPLQLGVTLNGGAGVNLASLVVSEIPLGATLSDGAGGHSFTATTGSGNQQVDVHAWTLSNLTVTAPNDTNFTLTVTATEQDTAGISLPGTGTEQVTVNPLPPTVAPVAVTGKGVGSPITLALGIVVNSETGSNGDGPHTNSLYAVTISDIPSGATLSNSHGDTLSIAGGSITFDAAQLAGGVLTGLAITPANSSNFALHIAATEADFEVDLSATGTGIETITVNPLGPPPPTVSPVAVTGVEDSAIKLDLGVTVNGSGNTLASLVVGAIPIGATLSDDLGNHFTAMPGLGNQQTDVGGWDFANLTITPPTEFEGSFNLSVTATEQNAALVQSTATGNEAVTVNGVAETPVVSTPTAQTTTENHAAIGLTGLAVSSPDPGTSDDNDIYNVTLSVNDGTLSVATHTGLTGTFSGSSIAFSGSLAEVNAALADNNISYTVAKEFEGTDTLTFSATTTEESAVGGNGPSAAATQTATITVNGVAETPVVSTPTAQTTTENHAAIGLTGLAVSSPDPGTSDDNDIYNVTLSVNDGTLSVATHTGLTGTFSGSSIAFSGSLAEVNAALADNNISYTVAKEFEGTDTLTFSATTTEESAVGGNGPSAAATQTATITVNGVAETPVVSTPTAQTTTENHAAIGLTGLAVSSPDPGTSDDNDIYNVTLSVNDGTLSVATHTGLTGTFSGSSIAFSGSLAEVNAALADNNISYTVAKEFEGTDTLTFSATTTEESAVGGNGPSAAATQTATITVNGVAETPVVSTPTAQTTTENHAAIGLTGLAVSSPDPGTSDDNDIYNVTLSVNDGTLSVATHTGLTGTFSGSSIAFSGSLAEVNAALADNNISYTVAKEFEGTDTLTFSATTTEESAVGGNGPSAAATQTATITVNGVAETPVVSTPTAQTTTENHAAIGLTGLAVSSPDPGTSDDNDIYNVTLSVNDGTLSVATHTGLTGTFSGSSIAFSGSLAEVNAALADNNISYTVAKEFEGTDTLTFSATTTEESAVGGNGPSAAATQTATITVNGVAETPVVSTPTAQTTTENHAAIGLTGLAVSSPDPGTSDDNDIYNVTLSVNDGTLSVATHTGLTGTFSGSSIAFSGSLAEVNAALADNNISYTVAKEFEGTDTLTFSATTTEESAVGGNGPSAAATQTATITVNGVAETPVVSTPTAQTTTENHAAIGLTGLAVSSPDPGTSDDNDIYNVTLSVNDGTLSVATHTGLTGTFSGSSIAFSGSLAEVNAALADNNISYTVAKEFEGTDTLTFSATTTEESAVGGNGPSAAATQTATITVNGVAETPVVSTPTAQTTTENHAAIGLTGLAVSSPDPGTSDDNDIYNVTLSVNDGTLSVATHTGLTGTFSGSSIAFSGSLAEVNAALADNNISYTVAKEFEGTDTLTFSATTTEESAVGGNGPSAAATQTATITVNGVAETPVVSTPTAQTTTENHAAIGLTGLAVSSPDPGTSDDNDIYNVTLSVNDGTLSVATHTGLTGTFSGSSIAFSGSLAEVNAALADNNISYTVAKEFEGTDTLTFSATTTEESAVGGNGPSAAATQTATITVNGVADTPVVSTPTSATTTEDVAIKLAGLSVKPADASGNDGTDSFTATLYVDDGTLTLGTGNFTVTSSGAGTDASHLTITGSLANVNAALGAVTYTPTSGFAGNDTVHFSAFSTEEASVGGDVSANSATLTATITIASNPLIGTLQGLKNGNAVEAQTVKVATLTDHGISVLGVAGVVYSWQVSSDGGNSWLQVGNQLTFTPNATFDGDLLQVVITDFADKGAPATLTLSAGTVVDEETAGFVYAEASSGGLWNQSQTWSTHSVPIATTNAEVVSSNSPSTQAVNVNDIESAASLSVNGNTALVKDDGNLTVVGALTVLNGGTFKLDSTGAFLAAGSITGTITGTANATVEGSSPTSNTFTVPPHTGPWAEIITTATISESSSKTIAGWLAIDSGATLTLNGGTQSENVLFGNDFPDNHLYTGMLVIAAATAYTGTVYGFTASGGYSDEIVLQGVNHNSVNFQESYNSHTGQLTVTDGTNTETFFLSGFTGTLQFNTDGHVGTLITDPPAGSDTTTIHSGAALDIVAASTQNIGFANDQGDTGMLVLDDPAQFTGQISGFAGTAPETSHSDAIDLVGINYNSPGFSETYDASTGRLTVCDGSTTANLTFANLSGALDFASDGHGGTLITDPPASSTLTSECVISLAGAEPADTFSEHVTSDGSNYIGSVSLSAVTLSNGGTSVDFEFWLGSDQINLAPRQTLTQSYNVSVTDAQNAAANVNQSVSVSIGGPGNDNFVFTPGVGADTIVNFNAQNDTIELDHFANARTIQELQSLISTDIHGNAVIDFGHNDSVTLPGITADQLQHIVQAGHVLLH